MPLLVQSKRNPPPRLEDDLLRPALPWKGLLQEDDDQQHDVSRRAAFASAHTSPPADGFEYLKSVRRQARTIPDVVAVQLPAQLLQPDFPSQYHTLPPLPSTPPALKGQPAWEEELLSDFRALREKLAGISSHHSNNFPLLNDASAWEDYCSTHAPLVHIVRLLDQRRSLKILAHLHSGIEREGHLSEMHAQWIFSLLTRIESALPADSCALLRGLLRSLALLRWNLAWASEGLSCEDLAMGASLSTLLCLLRCRSFCFTNLVCLAFSAVVQIQQRV